MWWQVLPPSFTILGIVAIPMIAAPIIHFVFTGRPTMRGLVESNHIEMYSRHGYRRDWSMNGNEYESKGLDNITDNL